MSELSLVSMLLLGLTGMGHCVGMCGPLVVAFPARNPGLLNHLAYHFGRVLSYVVVGAVVGFIGSAGKLLPASSSDSLVTLTQIQAFVAVLAAALMLILGLVRLGFLTEPAVMSIVTPTRVPGFKLVQEAAMGGRNPAAMLALGTLLGFIPCGLSYAAFARALAAGGAAQGAMLVLAFGVGTVPALLAVGLGAANFLQRHRRVLDLVSGMLMIGMAVALLADVFAMF